MMKMNYVVLWKLCVSVVLTGVHSVGADRVSVNVTEGDPVTLHTNVTTIQHETIRWFFNDIRIAEIKSSFICTDVQCKDGDERFRDRLKLDHQTGSLTIMNTRTTDSGVYTLHIIYTGGDSDKFFSVTVHVGSAEQDQMKGTSEKEEESVPDSDLSSAAVAGICVAVVLLIVTAAAVIYYRKRPQAGQCRSGTRTQSSDQENGVMYTPVNRADNGSEPAATEPSRDGNVNTSETSG